MYFLLLFTEDFLLEDISKYKFMSAGNVHVPGLEDVQEFQTTVDAMKIMNISEDDVACKSNETPRYIHLHRYLSLFLPRKRTDRDPDK